MGFGRRFVPISIQPLRHQRGVITDALSKTFNNWVADATYKAAELED